MTGFAINGRCAKQPARKSRKRLWLCAIVLGPLLLFGWIAFSFATEIKAFATGAACIGSIAFAQMPVAAAKKQVKTGINAAIAESLGFRFRIDGAAGPGFARATQFGLVPKHQRARFEDHWNGELAGHRFDLHEAKLEERRGSGKNRRWVTVFRGAILVMQTGRAIHSRTLLLREGRHRSFFGLGGRKGAIRIDGEEFQCVPFVHPAFEDIFDAWSTDPVEARYLIHPTYVERLIGIEQGFAGKDICALFDGRSGREGASPGGRNGRNREIVIARKTGNLFESGSMNADADERMVARTIEQFATLASLAQAFNETDAR